MMQQAPLLRLQGVEKEFMLGETRVSALRGVDFAVYPGDFVAVVGASGSGKSTLLHIAAGLDTPTRGHCELLGRPVATMTDTQRSLMRNRFMGFIFQSFNLMPVLTVYENVELPMLVNPKFDRVERHKAVMESIEEVGLSDRMHHYPDKLSGGQRQRCAIARAIAAGPRLVFADEPTANLDSVTAKRVIDLMRHMSKKSGVAFVFATHDSRLLERVDNVHTLQDGVMAE